MCLLCNSDEKFGKIMLLAGRWYKQRLFYLHKFHRDLSKGFDMAALPKRARVYSSNKICTSRGN
jgi:hypothetical protein